MNTTELIARLKLAAEKASNGEWVKESGDGWEAACSANDRANSGFIIAHFEGPDAAANREFVQAANPVNVQALVEALESAQEIRAAAEKLVRCKGRYHSEQNYRALAALFGVTTPDLPPMSEDTQTVVVIPPAYVDGNTLGYGEVNHMIDLCVDSFERACHAAGIKCEVKGE